MHIRLKDHIDYRILHDYEESTSVDKDSFENYEGYAYSNKERVIDYQELRGILLAELRRLKEFKIKTIKENPLERKECDWCKKKTINLYGGVCDKCIEKESYKAIGGSE